MTNLKSQDPGLLSIKAGDKIAFSGQNTLYIARVAHSPDDERSRILVDRAKRNKFCEVLVQSVKKDDLGIFSFKCDNLHRWFVDSDHRVWAKEVDNYIEDESCHFQVIPISGNHCLISSVFFLAEKPYLQEVYAGDEKKRRYIEAKQDVTDIHNVNVFLVHK